MIESLHAPEPRVRYFAAILLGRMGRDAVDAVPGLIALLSETPVVTDDRDDPGRAAAMALGQIAPGTPRADDAIAALRQAQAADEGYRSRAIAEAIHDFEPSLGVAAKP